MQVMYCDSDGVIEDARKWVKKMGFTAEEVKIVKRGECVCVVKREQKPRY